MANDPRLEAAVRAAEAGFYQALRRLHEDGVEPLLAHWSAAEAVTAMNAAGGYECGAAAVAGRWAWWRAQGRPMPATAVEHLAFEVTPTLAYTVALEHHGDRVLRVTHVYGCEDGVWRLRHRHADPLVERRS